jgi:mannose-6-phosphate isomerase-like protein (cupin superfamily)
LAALDQALIEAAAAAEDPAVAGFAALARSIDRGAERPRVAGPARQLPVCRYWVAALAGAPGSLGPALESLGPALSWTQNPNYRRQPPDPRFLDNYGYAVIAGPADGPAALAVEPRLALGVLLLGPDTHYPLHHHPAAEIYYTLSPDGEWWRGAGPWRREPPGAVIYHTPSVPHATRAGASPLLAVYLWQGHLATHAQLGSDPGPARRA